MTAREHDVNLLTDEYIIQNLQWNIDEPIDNPNTGMSLGPEGLNFQDLAHRLTLIKLPVHTNAVEVHFTWFASESTTRLLFQVPLGDMSYYELLTGLNNYFRWYEQTHSDDSHPTDDHSYYDGLEVDVKVNDEGILIINVNDEGIPIINVRFD